MKSRKLKRFEQAHSKARLATPESTLTVSNYRIEILKVSEFFKSSFLKKSLKTSDVENYKDLRSEIWTQDSKPQNLPGQPSTTRLIISNFQKFLKIKFSFKFFEKSRKLPYFVTLKDVIIHMDAKNSTPV